MLPPFKGSKEGEREKDRKGEREKYRKRRRRGIRYINDARHEDDHDARTPRLVYLHISFWSLCLFLFFFPFLWDGSAFVLLVFGLYEKEAGGGGGEEEEKKAST